MSVRLFEVAMSPSTVNEQQQYGSLDGLGFHSEFVRSPGCRSLWGFGPRGLVR